MIQTHLVQGLGAFKHPRLVALASQLFLLCCSNEAYSTVGKYASRGAGDKGGKKRKGLVKEQVKMAHGHGQQGGDWLWEQEVQGQERAMWENWDNCNRTTTNKITKIKITVSFHSSAFSPKLLGSYLLAIAQD